MLVTRSCLTILAAQVDNQALPKAYQSYLNPPPEQERTTGEYIMRIRSNIDRYALIPRRSNVAHPLASFTLGLKKSDRPFFQKPETKKTIENILIAMFNYTNSEMLSNPAMVRHCCRHSSSLILRRSISSRPSFT